MNASPFYLNKKLMDSNRIGYQLLGVRTGAFPESRPFAVWGHVRPGGVREFEDYDRHVLNQNVTI